MIDKWITRTVFGRGVGEGFQSSVGRTRAIRHTAPPLRSAKQRAYHNPCDQNVLINVAYFPGITASVPH